MVDRILDAAARIFEASGYHSTTTNHVAHAAGVSVGSLYQYFPNKDSLLVALAERHVAEAAAQLREVIAKLRSEAPDVVGTCRAFVSAAVAVNRPDTLHRILWTAPRTAALDATLRDLDRLLVAEVSWHFERFGHPSDIATRRAEILAMAVSAAIHQLADDEQRNEELVRLCVAYVDNR